MKKTSTTEARSHLPELIDEVRSGKEVVVFYKHKKAVAVLIDVERFKLMEELEDSYWSEQLKQAMKKDKLLGPKATAKFIQDKLEKFKA